MNAHLFRSLEGMATLTADGVEIFSTLEDVFLGWATRSGARPMRYPALVRVADLDALDYFRNFPQLVMCACTLDAGTHGGYSQRPEQAALAALPSGDLEHARYCLPPGACYNVYLGLRGSALETAHYVTTSATCFRNENHFHSLERLRTFTMREVVCVGPPEAVKAHLSDYRERLQRFAEHLGLPTSLTPASDPFFDKGSTSARAERIFPTKEELVYDGRLAIGSINYHRRFFGKRCHISVAGVTASTGCIAFGIERWIHALTEHFGADTQRIVQALRAADAAVAGAQPRRNEARAAGS